MILLSNHGNRHFDVVLCRFVFLLVGWLFIGQDCVALGQVCVCVCDLKWFTTETDSDVKSFVMVFRRTLPPPSPRIQLFKSGCWGRNIVSTRATFLQVREFLILFYVLVPHWSKSFERVASGSDFLLACASRSRAPCSCLFRCIRRFNFLLARQLHQAVVG